jgi:thioredoxin 1
VGILDMLTGGPKKDPEHLTDDTFKDTVVNGGGAWVVDFWGPSCSWCSKLVPTIRILTAKYQGKVRFGELETSGNPKVTAAYGVKGTPTLIFIKGGRTVERLSGYQTQQYIEEVIAAHLGGQAPGGAGA